jgi:hypothetical protein
MEQSVEWLLYGPDEGRLLAENCRMSVLDSGHWGQRQLSEFSLGA